MPPFVRLLAGIVSLGMAGFVQAQAGDFACGAGAGSAIAVKGADVSGAPNASVPHLLIEFINAAVSAEPRTKVAGPASRDPGETSAQLVRVADSRAVQPADDSAGSLNAPDGEPTDWTMLLCGLVVVAFIARRKASWATN